VSPARRWTWSVVELTEKDVEPLVAALGDRFHVDPGALRRAIRERSSTGVSDLLQRALSEARGQ
jgi:hypothetical protein